MFLAKEKYLNVPSLLLSERTTSATSLPTNIAPMGMYKDERAYCKNQGFEHIF